MKQLILLLCCVVSLMLASCSDGTSKVGANPEESDDMVITTDELIGKWERHSAEGIYTLYVMSDGTGKLVSYEHASAATAKFRYTVTDKGVVVNWDKLRKETYHAVQTVDGKYLVLDNGSSVYVYKKMKK